MFLMSLFERTFIMLKKNKQIFKITASDVAMAGIMVGLITLGTFLDDFMPKIGGYTALNL